MHPVPTSLSPSRVEAFTSCPMAFRFASIDKIPEPPSAHMTKGSFVHRVLELLFMEAPAERTQALAQIAFDRARSEYLTDEEFVQLALDDAACEAFFADARSLIDAYFTMEDPRAVREIGVELRLEASVGTLALRGIIDRLELDADGGLVVTDYKTGRAPTQRYEQSRLSGVHFYSFLCEAVLGRRPTAIRLMYLRTGETITATPSAQSVKFITTRTQAVWKAVERACLTDSFQPRQGPLCTTCAYQPWCPAFGGGPVARRGRGAGPLRPGRPCDGMTLGASLVAPQVEAFDSWADARLEHLRGHPVADRLFTAASELGDFSRIWHLVNLARATRSRQAARRSVAFAGLLGAESVIVNQGVKRLFRRVRPTETGDVRYRQRRPSTSSFPSGHASSAFFAATLLIAHDGRRSIPVWGSIATVVATSRAYVRIHHPSDVVAGAVLGVALGRVALTVARRIGWPVD